MIHMIVVIKPSLVQTTPYNELLIRGRELEIDVQQRYIHFKRIKHIRDIS